MRLDGPEKNIMSVACFFPSPLSNHLSSFERLDVGSKKWKFLDQTTSADGYKVEQSRELIIGKVTSLVLMYKTLESCLTSVVGQQIKISVCMASKDALWSRILINDGTGIAAESNQRIACVWQGFRSKFCLWCVVRAYLDFNAWDENLSLLHSGD